MIMTSSTERIGVPAAKFRRCLSALVVGLLMAWNGTGTLAQPQAPVYDECRLDSLFPNGGRRGTSVKVELKGVGSGLTGPRQIVIDGPPGISAGDLKSINGGLIEATLTIAPDAPLGRRWLRVLNERSGLTCFAHFVVGSLPEQLEVEPNEDLANPCVIQTPIVVNGRINPAADQDVFRFAGKRGQTLIAAIAAHALDIHGQYKNAGIADFSLELLDSQGRTLAAAEDTVGFDPIIEQVLPADGDYFVRVTLLNFGGFPEAVYRLTLGDVPYVTAAFPAGYQRGTETRLDLLGPRVARGQQVIVGKLAPNPTGTGAGEFDPAYPLRHITHSEGESSGLDVPIVVGDLPEVVESEPNNDVAMATELKCPVTTNGRFSEAGDVDWYRVRLEANQKVWFETVAHRFIRSPVDTLIQVYDGSGKLLTENDDDAFDPGYESLHDYRTTDSKVLFSTPAAGDYFVKVSEQNGMGSPSAIYRLTFRGAEPEFQVTHFPESIPIWGPGTTACVMARVDRYADCQEDIEVSVVGLPEGWSSRTAVSLGRTPQRYYNNYQNKLFLTITAPADAPVGTMAPIRIVGRIRPKTAAIVAGATPTTAGTAATPDGPIANPVGAEARPSIPLNLFYSSDTGFFRASPLSRVVVAKPQGPWLEAITRECTLAPGGTTSLEVRVHEAGELREMPVVVSLVTNGVASGLTTPQNIPIQNGIISVPIKLPTDMPIGSFGITVAQSWRNDIRVGMPGPCTALLPLNVVPAK